MRLRNDTMTTYLATQVAEWPIQMRGESVTDVFCSKNCRGMAEPYEWITRDDDSYEFDEVCASCGKLVLASHN